MPTEHVTEFEIEAYIDDELDLARRLAVEEYLSAHADLAARVMHDLSARTALRMLQPQLAPAPALDTLARHLATRLNQRPSRFGRLFSPLRIALGGGLAVATAALTMVAVPNHATAPNYVGDAAQSYRTGLLRRAMASQPETARFDPRDIQRETQIRVPKLRADWTITDVQIFPSDDGPALQIMARTAAGQAVSVFAVRTDARTPARPVEVTSNGASVAYWSRHGIGYAVVGTGIPALNTVAEDLADNQLS